MPPRPVRVRVERALVGAFLGFHLLTMGASMAQGSPAGDYVRKLTRSYERWMGVYQDWPMFAPNPPRSVSWLELRGRTAAGDEVVLPGLWGAPEPPAFAWRYSRLSKLERTLLKDNRKPGRLELLAHACTTADPPITRAWAVEVQQGLPPADRLADVPAPGRKDLESIQCDRGAR